MRMKGIAWAAAAALATLAACDRAPENATATQAGKASNPALGARWQYPRTREANGRKVIVYAPQIRTWDQFKHFTAQVAIEFPGENEAARYAVIDLSGETALDRDARLVRVAKPIVERTGHGGHAREIRMIGHE